jgi:D-alanine-D-alanine ligase
MATKRIAIVAGGFSSEYPVSLKSAAGIKKFLETTPYETYVVKITRDVWEVQLPDGSTSEIDKNDFSFVEDFQIKKFDFAYITIHGVPGENGALQGYFDMISLPYSCCDVFAAALTANKYSCNKYLSTFGVRVSPSVMIRPGDKYSVGDIISEVTLPCFVKPNEGGSSFATTKVKEESELAKAIGDAFTEGGNVIVEKFMQGTEVTCGCYKTGAKSVVFPITEVVSKNEFFDYEAKYTASKVEEITPARIADEVAAEISATTSKIYDIIGARGIIRVDYIIIEGEPYLLEVNTTPGMTETSFIPQQIRATGVEPGVVLTEIIEDILQTK